MINKMIKKHTKNLINLKNLGKIQTCNEGINTKNNGSNNGKDFTSKEIFNENYSKSKNQILFKSHSIIETNNENRNFPNLINANFNFNSNKLKKISEFNKIDKIEQTTNPDSEIKIDKNISNQSYPVGMDIDYPLKKKEPRVSMFAEKNFSPKFDMTITFSDENIKPYPDCILSKDKYCPNQQVPLEYLGDIMDNLLKDELVIEINYDSMKAQSDINYKMRAILIDWLIDVNLKFKLLPESLFLTTNLIDRYIMKKQILRSKLQLLGIASLLIACKYEEIYSPELRDFVYITDKAFSKPEILAMERDILITLDFIITIPSILIFLEILAIKFTFNDKDFALAMYLVEIFLIDFRINRYNSSVVASTAIYIVLKLNKDERITEIFDISRKTEMQLKECAKDILYLVQNIEASPLQAVKKKYASSKFYEVSKIRFC